MTLPAAVFDKRDLALLGIAVGVSAAGYGGAGRNSSNNSEDVRRPNTNEMHD